MLPSTYPLLRDEDGGEDFRLAGRIVTFGASKECSLKLAGKSVEDRMGHFLFREGRYHLQALSHDGRIKVNGIPVLEPMALADDARIEICGRRYRYLDGTGPIADAPPAADNSLASFGEVIGALVQLLRDRSTDVFGTLVAGVSRLLLCDAARVVEEDAVTGERRTIARFPSHSGLERFSSRAIDWAKASTKAILMQEADWEDLNSISSLRKNAVSSVLCVALRGEGAILGYLYMDRMGSRSPFSESDRSLCDILSLLFGEVLTNRNELQRQKETISRLQAAGPGAQSGIIHESRPMVELMELARKVARTDAAVLIRGETGTGKEMLARFLHEKSMRAEKSFRALNCGAIPENLIESELFGHEKGAFTGADQRKIGLFEAAEGGTLFLDEIGDLHLSLQVKLLRVLQESEIMRIGNPNPIRINVRILSATHRDLKKEVAEGRFRQDLFFRLAVLDLVLPPLRERGQDVLLLSEYLLKKYLLQFGLPPKTFSSLARNKLLTYGFPGNVRELENVIQKAILLSNSSSIGPDELHSEARGPDGNGQTAMPSLKDSRSQSDKKSITAALEKATGNISMAAKMLDTDRKWLMKLMEELDLHADAYRKPSGG